MFTKNNLSGMTLIETLIALALSLLLVSVIFSIYGYLQKNNYQQQAFFSAIEAGAEISHVLTQEIHQAGFIGCAKLTADFPVQNHSRIKLDKRIVPLGDGFSLWYAEDQAMSLVKSMDSLSDVVVDTRFALGAQAVLLISDCKSADIFVVNGVTKERGHVIIHSSQPLSKLYDAHAEIFLLVKKSFYVTQVDGHSALVSEDLHHNKVELARDVKKMQVTYFVGNQIQKSGSALGVNDVVNAVNIEVQFKNLPSWYVYAATREN